MWNGGPGDSITVDAWKVLINSHYFLHWLIILSLLGYSCLVSLLTKVDPQMPLIFNFSVYKIWKIETFVRMLCVFIYFFIFHSFNRNETHMQKNLNLLSFLPGF